MAKPKQKVEDFIQTNTLSEEIVMKCDNCGEEDPMCFLCVDEAGNFTQTEGEHCVGNGIVHLCKTHLQVLVDQGLTLAKRRE